MSNAKFVVGLDVSTKTIGVTLMDVTGKLEDMFYISPPKSNKKNGEIDIYDKVEYVEKIFRELNLNIRHIFIEEPLKNGPNINTVILLAKFNGMISQKMKDIYGIAPIHLTVHEARSHFFPEFVQTKKVKTEIKETLSFPKGVDKKQVVFEKVNSLEPYFEWKRRKDLSLKEENFDMADSYVVAKSGLLKVGLITKI